MGSHHDVNGSIGNAFKRCGDFLARAKTADLRYFDRPFAKPVDQSLVVLLGQKRCGGQQRDLFAAGDSNKGGPQRDFSFTKTYVATNQSVHRPGADHVLNHRVDGSALIRGFIKAEIIGKGFVVLGAVAKRMAFSHSASGVDVQKLGGGVSNLFGRAAFGFFPLAAA